MAEVRTEEEQVEALKQWFKKNGSSLLIGIGLAIALVFGWQTWQDRQAAERSAAASQFSNLLNSLQQEDGEERRETVRYLSGELQENFESSAYAVYGTLILAQQQLMEEDDAEAAVDSLKWAGARVDDDSPMALVLRNRLAQAQLSAGQHEEALETVRGAEQTGAFEALLAELEGDILMASGDREGAIEAYRKARQAPSQGGSGILELKMADLGIGEDA